MSGRQEPNVDQRIQKSKQSLYAAIFKLLEKISFIELTVHDICKTARVSRTTFYQHFRDKYELIRCALEAETWELKQSSGGDLEKETRSLLDFVDRHKTVFRNLNEQNEELFFLLNDISIASLEGHLEKVGKLPGDIPLDFHAAFLAGGRAWLLLRWIKTGCQVPKERLEEYLVTMLEAKAISRA